VFEEVLTRSEGVEGFETEFADQSEDSLLTGANPLSTDFNDFALTDGMVERTATHAVPGLEHDDVDALRSQYSCSRQAGQSSAYHDHHG
jgi:hypothetical protein